MQRVCLSVCHTTALCQNGKTYRNSFMAEHFLILELNIFTKFRQEHVIYKRNRDFRAISCRAGAR